MLSGSIFLEAFIVFYCWNAVSPHGVFTPSNTCTRQGMEQFYQKPDMFPYQSIEEIDFPTVDRDTPRIPHILHQIYNEKYIPTIYIEFVESFLRFNPSWQYRFWTYSSGRKLLQLRFPHLLETFDGFGNSVEKADMLRYLVLYEYGGVYADLDMEFYKPLDRLTMKYAAIIGLEPREHAALKYNRFYALINCFMMSRPKHPFFKLVLDGLLGAKAVGKPVLTTGPAYITNLFKQYNGINKDNENEVKIEFSSNSPNFFKGYRREEDNDNVYLPNSQYVMNNIKENVLSVLNDICFVEDITKLPYFQYQACLEFHRRKTVRENMKFTYAEHHWSCLWKKSKEFIINLGRVYIGDIVKNCTFYEEP
ncbi:hypothetical protein ACF0H5_022170 [Mactra antiquata]